MLHSPNTRCSHMQEVIKILGHGQSTAPIEFDAPLSDQALSIIEEVVFEPASGSNFSAKGSPHTVTMWSQYKSGARLRMCE